MQQNVANSVKGGILMSQMLNIQIDDVVAESILREEIQKKADKIAVTRLFWDMKELCRQVSLSENTVKETFFHDPGFPKFRVGKKWLINAQLAEAFLNDWSKHQPGN